MRFWLEYRGHHFELRQGLLNLGRSASCQLVLDDALVSRRHAQITVVADNVSVTDLGSAKRDLDHSFEDTVREIQNVIDQMDDAERKQYLSESLFLNFVSYENERLGAYMKRLTKKA